jgi:uncharacterized protein (TIGR02444 family)
VTLWGWVLAAWARPGVSETCLELQDRHGQCVALLLWRLWAAAEHRAVSKDDLALAVGVARPFEEDVLAPLRAARRAVEKGDLHAKIRAAELAAERDLLVRLEEATPARGEAPRTEAVAALAALMTAWNGAGDEAARLAAKLSLC